MPKLASPFLAALVALVGLIHGSGQASSARAHLDRDDAVLRHASRMLGQESRAYVVRWLRHQRSVGSADVARDGVTLDIAFADGRQSIIFGSEPVPSLPLHARPLPLVVARVSDPAGSSRRALVLEPFATELHLGTHAGDAVADELRSAGFQVDQVYDQNVTVQSMEDLWRYDVIYMDTHSGVNQYGEGVVGTGQPANGDPAIDPYIKDGTVIVGGVAGSDQLYYGILSAFIVQHEQQFEPGSLAFINGCTLLLGTVFWQALRYQGVGALISWYDDVAPPSASVAAQLVFGDLIRRRTVEEAVAGAGVQGFALTNGTGGPAHLGYLGDGSLTLWPTPSTPTPTLTPRSTATPLPTRTSIPTSTSLPTPTSTPTEVGSCTHGRYLASNHCR